MAELTYKRGAALPNAELWLYDDDETSLDLSSGYTFEFKIGALGAAAVLEKTTGITGAAQAGVRPTGTPACTINWAAGDLDIPAGRYVWELIATSGGEDRFFHGTFTILATIA